MFAAFWSRHPALFLSLCILLGTAIAFEPLLCLWIVFAVLCATASSRRTLILAVICFAAAYTSTAFRHPPLHLEQEKVPGKALFHIDQVKISTSPFSRSLLYKGVLKHFETNEGIVYTDLPCSIFLPLYGKHPPANTDYVIRGNLLQKADYAFVLKPEKNAQWTPLPSSWNLSEWRFQAKQAVSRYLKQEIADSHTRTFLNALTTGDVDERILAMELNKVGLQHILAISGFHFALAAFFLSYLLRLVFPDKISTILLIIALTAYYLFLGDTPSIQRAYVAIVLFALARCFSLRTSGLNALGVGLIVELLFHPLAVLQLGFQLTFLCTLAILLFYPVALSWVSYLLPKRTFAEASGMSLFDKHGLLICAWLRQALALNIAVHLVSLPVMLYLFHKFPLLSIAYNLIFPYCVCVSMFLLFISFLFAPLLPFVSHALHFLNTKWTSAILQLTTHSPAYLDFSLRCKALPFPLVICFLSACFCLGVFYNQKQQSADWKLSH